MKKKTIKNIFLISLISIFLLVFNIVVKKYTFIYAESIMAAFMIVIVALSIQLFGFQKDKNNRIKNILLIQVAQILATYFIIIYALGIFFGYSKIVFSLRPMSILNNTFAPILTFICLEVFRYIVTTNNRDNKKNIIIFGIIIGLIELSISTKYLYFNSLETGYKSFADFILPITINQLTFCYLCYYGGLKPTLLYRMIMILYTYVIPIHPSLNEIIICMCNILVPTLILIKANNVIEEETKEKELIQKNEPVIGKLIGATVVLVLVLFVLGVMPVGITAIASDSMHPTFSKGAGVITLKVSENKLKKGDIISFRHQNKTIVHRIDSIEKFEDETRYYTKGDANSSIDDGYITYDAIENKIIASIPLIGYPSIMVWEWLSK